MGTFDRLSPAISERDEHLTGSDGRLARFGRHCHYQVRVDPGVSRLDPAAARRHKPHEQQDEDSRRKVPEHGPSELGTYHRHLTRYNENRAPTG
jgi:hypothetical protein